MFEGLAIFDKLFMMGLSAILMILIFEIMMITIFTYSAYQSTKMFKRWIELKELDMQCKYDYKFEVIINELYEVINDVFTRHIVLYRYDLIENKALSELAENQLCSEIAGIVSKSLSPALVARISQTYNREELGTLIMHRIILLLSEFCNSNNIEREKK